MIRGGYVPHCWKNCPRSDEPISVWTLLIIIGVALGLPLLLLICDMCLDKCLNMCRRRRRARMMEEEVQPAHEL